MVLLGLTVAQLAVGAFGDLDQYDGKGFGYRLLVYPLLMLLMPAAWWWRTRDASNLPWGAFALIMAPFFIDITGNTLDLLTEFEPVWTTSTTSSTGCCCCWGCRPADRPRRITRWLLVFGITGLGAILAVGWELGEWYTFIRRGTELDGAYEDTLSDELLGTLGAFVGALIVDRTTRPARVKEPVG